MICDNDASERADSTWIDCQGVAGHAQELRDFLIDRYALPVIAGGDEEHPPTRWLRLSAALPPEELDGVRERTRAGIAAYEAYVLSRC